VAPARELAERAAEPRRDHDLVEDERRLLDGPEDRPRGHFRADLRDRGELPLLLLVERRGVESPGDEVPDALLDDIERTLDAVVDGFQKSRAELDAQGLAGRLDGVSRTDAGRVLVDLDRGGARDEPDDLPDQAEGADADDVVHLRVVEPFGDDDRTRDPPDASGHRSLSRSEGPA